MKVKTAWDEGAAQRQGVFLACVQPWVWSLLLAKSLKALLQQDSSLSLTICLVAVVKMSRRRNLKREAIVWLPFQRHGSS